MKKKFIPVVELTNIVKRFGNVIANKNINLKVYKGEVHAIVGENGAGKSTLMKILYGLYTPDEGDIFIKGNKIEKNSPFLSIKNGIGMVHQHFMLVPPLTVTENVILGMEVIKNGIFIDLKKASSEIKRLSNQYNLNIDPDKKIEELSVGEQQRVEIIKVLYRGVDILILDEPTAVLTPQEVEEFFKVIKNLVNDGKTAIIITHKLDEVMKISTRATVIRRGETVDTIETKKTNQQELARLMVGRDVLLQLEKTESKIEDVVLKVENLSVLKQNNILAIKDVSFEVRSGEILGIAGVEGNGQTELIEALTGLRKIKSGKIILNGNDITYKTPKERFKMGLSHIPEDRHKRGLILDYSIADNLILGMQDLFTGKFQLDFNKINNNACQKISEFDIRPPDRKLKVKGLSGGNQQKVIIARELSRESNFIIAAQPTRGVDIGAIEFIHNQILKMKSMGKAVLLISAELSEIFSLSDRIAVLYDGRIVGIVDTINITEPEVGIMMTGGKLS